MSVFHKCVPSISSINGSKLPSRRQVLGRLQYRIKENKNSVNEAAKFVIQEISVFWEKCNIPTMESRNSIRKLKEMYDKWSVIKKKYNRLSNKNPLNVTFLNTLDDLFDISHYKAMEIIDDERTREFLKMQRKKGRIGSIGAKIRSTKRAVQDLPETASLESIFTLENSQRVLTPELDDSPEVVIKKKDILTPHLAATLDRIGLSDRNAIYVITAVLDALDLNLDNYILNRETFRKTRQKRRKSAASVVKSAFHLSGPAVVHWDGKLLRDLDSKEIVDRMAVSVSSAGESHLLGIPKISSGTGENQATASFELLSEWNIGTKVVAGCFDTTASNTGPKKGACAILEQKLNKNLLWLACRHHIVELLMASAWDTFFGSSGPSVSIFCRFQARWPQLDKELKAEMVDYELVSQLGSEKDLIVRFVHDQLQQHQLRDDYKELLMLVLMFCGVENGQFRCPGAHSRARWMAKAIYCLKIWMFRDQFHLSKIEKRRIPQICLFILRIYIVSWFSAPSALAAARNDLNLLKKLISHAKDHNEEPNPYLSAANKLNKHLWYLSDENIAMAFYDPHVTVEEKRAMVKSLHTREACEDRQVRRVVSLESITDASLENFVTKKTKDFFTITHLPSDFLKNDPSEWEHSDDFLKGLQFLRSLAVVNDCAERYVALVQNYCGKITRTEDQLQFLLHVVEQHRKQFPTANKKILKK